MVREEFYYANLDIIELALKNNEDLFFRNTSNNMVYKIKGIAERCDNNSIDKFIIYNHVSGICKRDFCRSLTNFLENFEMYNNV